MSKIRALLFDFDGVIANTEPQYDIYMDAVGEKHKLGIPNFSSVVKGTPTPDIIKKYFGSFSKEEQADIIKELDDFEQKMDFQEVNGAIDFIKLMKHKGYKIGLVTSSSLVKMERALRILNIENLFDTIVTANRITKGKPDPMCYLLAANDLGVLPEDCIVFEDSIHGVNSGIAAGMNVIGITTSFSKESMNFQIIGAYDNFILKNEIVDLIEHCK